MLRVRGFLTENARGRACPARGACRRTPHATKVQVLHCMKCSFYTPCRNRGSKCMGREPLCLTHGAVRLCSRARNGRAAGSARPDPISSPIGAGSQLLASQVGVTLEALVGRKKHTKSLNRSFLPYLAVELSSPSCQVVSAAE